MMRIQLHGHLLYLWEKTTRYHWGGGWVGPQLVWVLWEKEKLLFLLERFNCKVLGFLAGDKANWTWNWLHTALQWWAAEWVQIYLLLYSVDWEKSNILPLKKAYTLPNTKRCVKHRRLIFCHFMLVWVDLHLPLQGQQHPKCQCAIRLVYRHYFSTIRSSTKRTNKT